METVCIIDDDKIHHFTIQRSIQIQGFSKNLIFFNDGFDAIDFFKKNLYNPLVLPDIIFLDLNMPVVNGWQFLQQYGLIKNDIQKQIKIYVVSSSIDENDISRAIAIENVSGYMEKPLRPENLHSVFSPSPIN